VCGHMPHTYNQNVGDSVNWTGKWPGTCGWVARRLMA